MDDERRAPAGVPAERWATGPRAARVRITQLLARVPVRAQRLAHPVGSHAAVVMVSYHPRTVAMRREVTLLHCPSCQGPRVVTHGTLPTGTPHGHARRVAARV